MKKSGALALAAIVIGAVGLRWAPLLSFVYWGADIGEYFAILRDLAATGRVSFDYDGWGVTYPYFPGLFFVQGAVVALAPVDVTTVLNLLAPALGGLAVLPVFLLATMLTRRTSIGLLAAAFVATVMPHAYSTSHAAPSTLGDLLAFAGLLVFLRIPQDRRAILPALAISAALVITHHLATYFLILMVLLGMVVRGLLRPALAAKGGTRQAGTLAALLGMTFAFWFGYATTFRDGILRDVNVNPWWIIPASFPVLLAALVGLVRLRRRVPWRYRPRYPDLRHLAVVYGLAILFLFGLMGYGIVTAVPGTAIPLPPIVLAYFAPLTLAIAFAAAGRKFFDFHRGGHAPTGWLAALVLSTAFGAVAAPHVIIPFRHTEYLMVPLALFAGAGIAGLVDLRGTVSRGRAAAGALAGLLVVANAATAFPPPSIIVGWQEGARPAALDAAYWLRGHAAGLVAADHRASSLAFGFGGADATWDATRSPFLADSFAEGRHGFLEVRAPSGAADVAYVWVDRDIEAGVQLFPWEPAVPMSEASKGKFSDAPFVKVFDNGFARLYWIAWGCDDPGASC